MTRMSPRGLVDLSVEPREALVDDPVTILVRGLTSRQKVTLHARLENDNQRLASTAQFTATPEGTLDLRSSPSTGGTYTVLINMAGVEAMGLFWSMTFEPGQRKGLRLMKKNVTVPYNIRLSLLDGHIAQEDIYNQTPDPVCTEQVLRWYMSKDVTRREVNRGNIRGTMFIPPGKSPHLGVIDIFGTAGGILEFKASLLASRGFTTLSLPWFAYEGLPKLYSEVDFNYFIEAADWFKSQPEVDPSGIGVVGVSKGADFALLMGIYAPSVKAVVSIGGTPFPSFCDLKFGDSYFPGVLLDVSKLVSSEKGITAKEALAYKKHHLFPYKDMKAQVLVVMAEDDQCALPRFQREAISDLSREQRNKFHMLEYPKAGHLLEPPFSPICISSFHKELDVFVSWGGEIQPHARAQESSWKTIQSFLRETLTVEKPLETKL